MTRSRLLEWLDDSWPGTQEEPIRPGVTLSYAQSIDGSIAKVRGTPTPLSGAESSSATHIIRSRHQGILVGIGTVLADNPRLTVRPPVGTDPRPVVFDSRLQTPLESNILEGNRRALILHSTSGSSLRRKELISRGATPVEVEPSNGDSLDILSALEAIHNEGIATLMVEGGGAVIASFLRTGLWDRAAITVVPRWIGGYGPPIDNATDVQLHGVQWIPSGEDVLCLGRRTE